MLTSITIENFRSIDERISMSLIASRGINESDKGGVAKAHTSFVLTGAALYGANSSGKSNIILALNTMKRIIEHSAKLNDNEELPYSPFALSINEPRPTLFEISFYDNKDLFVYGFSYSSNRIEEEHLTLKSPRKSHKILFSRNSNGECTIDSSFNEGIDTYEVVQNPKNSLSLNSNRLFLSLIGQLGGAVSNRVIAWIQRKLVFLSGKESKKYTQVTRKMLHENSLLRAKILDFLKDLDLGFKDIETSLLNVEDIDFPIGFPEELKQQLRNQPLIDLRTVHSVYDREGNIIRNYTYNFEDFESEGTKKIFNLAGPIVESVQRGATIFIDELDAQMHPLLTRHIVGFFMSSEKNINSSQLIFTTHDTGLLSPSANLLRRDQIWLTGKDNRERTTIINLKDVQFNGHKTRNDANIEKNYLANNYGRTPDIKNLFAIDSIANEQ